MHSNSDRSAPADRKRSFIADDPTQTQEVFPSTPTSTVRSGLIRRLTKNSRNASPAHLHESAAVYVATKTILRQYSNSYW